MAQADPSRTEAGRGPPAVGPFSLELPDKGAFVSQATAYWCVPAAMQTMIDLIDDEQPFHSGQADQPATLDHLFQTFVERPRSPDA